MDTEQICKNDGNAFMANTELPTKPKEDMNENRNVYFSDTCVAYNYSRFIYIHTGLWVGKATEM